jgi:hypothetical protein
MANKYIKDLTGTTNPSLTGYTIFDDGITTYKTTLETLKDVIVDGESHTFEGDQTINGNLIVTGSITAKEFIVSSSVTYVTALAQSGSTVFGDSRNDTHRITGSVRITGSIDLNGSMNVQGIGIVKDSLFVSGFGVFGTPTHHSGSDPEVLHVGSYNSYNIAHFNANHDNYAQVNIKNVNSGTTASTDLVLTANNGTEDMCFVNLGINSSGYGAGNVGSANDGYLINKGSDLYIGTLSGDTGHNHVHLYTAGNWRNPAFTVFDNHSIGFNTQTLGPSDKYVFSGNTTFKNDVRVTGSLNVQGDVVINGTSYNAATSGTSGTSGSSGSSGSSGTSGDSIFAETGSVWSTTNDIQITGSLNVNGTAIIGGSIGGEGGEMMLVKPITNTNISGTGVIIDSYQDRIRIFEQGGSTRGAFLDITKQSNSVGSQIVTSPNLFSIQTITSTSYAALTPVSGTLYIIID